MERTSQVADGVRRRIDVEAGHPVVEVKKKSAFVGFTERRGAVVGAPTTRSGVSKALKMSRLSRTPVVASGSMGCAMRRRCVVTPRDATSVTARLTYHRRDGKPDAEDLWLRMASTYTLSSETVVPAPLDT